MGIAGGIAAASLAASLGSTIAGATSGGASGAGGGSPFLYQPQNQPGQDVNFNNILAQMVQAGQGLPQQLLPQYQAASQNITNNPFAGLQQQGANTVANMGTNVVAPWQFGGAQSLYGGANQIMSQAFDPQQALYNRTQQQLTDQINAANAAAGISGPAAAGVAQQGLTNFNIDWQNNLLNRQLAGERGAGQGFAGASDLGGLGLQTLQSSSGAPYNTFLGQQQNILGGLDAFSRGATSAFSLPQMALSNIQSYLGLGQSAGANALAGQAQAFNQNQLLGQQLATSLSNPSLQSGINQLFSSAPQQSPNSFNPSDPMSLFNFTNSPFSMFAGGGGGAAASGALDIGATDLGGFA